MKWQIQQTKDISKKLMNDRVFAAVGDSLKEAMIAHAVMMVLGRCVSVDKQVPAKQFEDLYVAVCRKVMPETWRLN